MQHTTGFVSSMNSIPLITFKNNFMTTLKYKVIKSKMQYKEYCNQLEALVFSGISKDSQDEIDLLTLLIETWDAAHNTFEDTDPLQLLRSLMEDHKMKAKDMVELLGTSKGYVSDILNYKKGLSKDVIRKLAAHFKVTQEAFNRPYKLAGASTKPALRKPKSKQVRKRLQAA
jgi:HTH-type transcriptional regulator/antitoxin HigA